MWDEKRVGARGKKQTTKRKGVYAGAIECRGGSPKSNKILWPTSRKSLMNFGI